jgi:PQQ-dependent catabolism-associated CXXCW motif protein
VIRRAVVLAICFVAFAGLEAQSQNPPPELTGDRMEDYRAPTPATHAGARVVRTAEAEQLWKAGAAFVDVLPDVPRPASLPAGTIWREKTRMNIPGSIWLPETGYGTLAAEFERYLRSGLERITNGDHARWLVIYCRRDCWMSWNAAKRALMMGYANVAWYPEGTEGWEAAGLPLQEAKPAPADAE